MDLCALGIVYVKERIRALEEQKCWIVPRDLKSKKLIGSFSQNVNRVRTILSIAMVGTRNPKSKWRLQKKNLVNNHVHNEGECMNWPTDRR